MFKGEAFGAIGTAIGEVVFNTGMTGYQEILTDPSYKGQMVTMTYPHIGNYGINPEDVESEKPQVEGFIVREYSPFPSNYRSLESLDEYLKRHAVCGIHQIDTRELTRHIREKGTMMGILSSEELSDQEMERRLKSHAGIIGEDLVCHVTTDKTIFWNENIPNRWYYDQIHPSGKKKFNIVVCDYGIKRNILRLMTTLGMKVTVVPASTHADKILALNPDGLFLSNGPGDPQGISYAIENVRTLLDKIPIFGICLGHQILALALGAKTFKLKFGHHGSNHPVKDLKTEEIEITAQNHNFAVDSDSLNGTGLEVTHLSLNDNTVEGMRHTKLPVFSVQYHPEASPGPHDSIHLFKRFVKLIES
jgi:carbamoyl-phosphate synthase small subunit